MTVEPSRHWWRIRSAATRKLSPLQQATGSYGWQRAPDAPSRGWYTVAQAHTVDQGVTRRKVYICHRRNVSTSRPKLRSLPKQGIFCVGFVSLRSSAIDHFQESVTEAKLRMDLAQFVYDLVTQRALRRKSLLQEWSRLNQRSHASKAVVSIQVHNYCNDSALH